MNVKLIRDQDAKPGGRFDTPNLQHAEKSLGGDKLSGCKSEGGLLLFDCFYSNQQNLGIQSIIMETHTHI